MTSRMDKHHTDSSQIKSRYKKNEKLYEELYTNKVYTEFSNVSNNVIDLSDLENTKILNKRELYHKNRILNNDDKGVSIRKSTFDYINNKHEDNTTKNYNINDILDEARKNRKIEDEDEKKRRVKSIEYSILSDLSQEKLKEYKEQKKQLSKQEEENLEELIHTITSNSLRKKIDDELLSDLLPTQELETVISKEETNSIDKKDDENGEDEVISNKIENTIEEEKIDNSFYTKSMDLSKEDFELDEEDDYSFLDGKKKRILPKILIALFILIVIGIIGYVIYRFI